MDLRTLSDDDLAVLRVEILTEQERRETVAAAPAQIAAMIAHAVQSGVPIEALHEATGLLDGNPDTLTA